MPVDHSDPDDRFGVPDQLTIDVMKEHSGLIRDGCYVPTRREVATWAPERLWFHLLGWWHESPSALIPTDEQVAACVAVLRSRGDADSSEEIQEIIAQAPMPGIAGQHDDPSEASDDEDD